MLKERWQTRDRWRKRGNKLIYIEGFDKNFKVAGRYRVPHIKTRVENTKRVVYYGKVLSYLRINQRVKEATKVLGIAGLTCGGPGSEGSLSLAPVYIALQYFLFTPGGIGGSPIPVPKKGDIKKLGKKASIPIRNSDEARWLRVKYKGVRKITILSLYLDSLTDLELLVAVGEAIFRHATAEVKAHMRRSKDFPPIEGIISRIKNLDHLITLIRSLDNKVPSERALDRPWVSPILIPQPPAEEDIAKEKERLRIQWKKGWLAVRKKQVAKGLRKSVARMPPGKHFMKKGEGKGFSRAATKHRNIYDYRGVGLIPPEIKKQSNWKQRDDVIQVPIKGVTGSWKREWRLKYIVNEDGAPGGTATKKYFPYTKEYRASVGKNVAKKLKNRPLVKGEIEENTPSPKAIKSNRNLMEALSLLR